jgi:hypothetical protein
MITYGGHQRVDEKGEYQHHHELLPLALSVESLLFLASRSIEKFFFNRGIRSSIEQHNAK